MIVDTARMPGTSGRGPDAPPRAPFGGKRRLADTVNVRLPGGRPLVRCDIGELRVRPGARLVVASSEGDIVAEAIGLVERRILNQNEGVRAVRLASSADVDRQAACTAAADEAVRKAVRAAKRLRLDIKVVAAHVPLTGNKTVLFYSAEQRADVRGLARELAAVLHGRVELRGIGVREGAGAIGGLGPCGHELCCSSFLMRFGAVSLRFAKDQGLSLNPGRVTGMCGRLKCCLVYEQSTYKEMKSYAPRRNNGAYTPSGAGNVLDVDIINRRVLVRLAGGALESFHVRDVTIVDRQLTYEEVEAGVPSKEQAVLDARKRRRGDTTGRSGRQATSVLREEYLWDDTKATAEITAEPESDDAGKAKKRRRRRGGRSRKGGESGAADASATTSGPEQAASGSGGRAKPAPDSGSAQAPAEGGAAKKRRRRGGRNRKRGGDGGEGGEGGGGSGGGSGGDGGGSGPS